MNKTRKPVDTDSVGGRRNIFRLHIKKDYAKAVTTFI